MDGSILKDKRVQIACVLIACTIIALVLRLFSIPQLTAGGQVRLFAEDTWYNLRQVEILTKTFTYPWFDPMTSYPQGKVLGWGPVFPIIASIPVWLSGAATRADVISVISWVPAVLGALMVPVLYFIGKTLRDWKTGLFAAASVAVISGIYFQRSAFGFPDHHISEILFSGLFCLAYIAALVQPRPESLRLKEPMTYRNTLIFSVFAGITLLLGLLTVPTFLLFVLIAVLFSLVQFIMDKYAGNDSGYLFVINGITFAVAAAGFAIFGLHSNSLSLSEYSPGLLAVLLVALAGIVVMYVLSVRLGNWKTYIVGVCAAAVAGLAVLFIGFSDVAGKMSQAATTFFFNLSNQKVIQEMGGWTIERAWSSYNIGLIFFIAGLALLLFVVVKQREKTSLFVLVWSAVLLSITILHMRYEYYLAVAVSLVIGLLFGYLVGVVQAWPVSTAKPYGQQKAPLVERKAQDREKTDRGKKKAKMPGKPAARSPASNPQYYTLVLVGVFLAFFAASAYHDYQTLTITRTDVLPAEWSEALNWAKSNLPDPGVPYIGIYDQENWTYPDTAYGVLSWWDYGHWITVIARKIPVTNPFQDNVRGRNGASAYFLSQSEDEAERIADHMGVRYVISDDRMGNTKFLSMIPWYNDSLSEGYFTTTFANPSAGGNDVWYIDAPYYHTMVGRLQNLDGSDTLPSKAAYVEYSDSDRANPVVIKSGTANYTTAVSMAEQYNRSAAPGTHAVVLGGSLSQPLDHVPALRHYRLIFESAPQGPEGHSVKIYERVEGAKIRGEGLIELDIVTNQGRHFTYRQQSQDGLFIVPYPTVNSTYEVRATGPYRIAGTSLQFSVSPEDLASGRQVN